MMFKAIEGENAIIVRGGVYRQCDIYERDGALYAKVGNGFIRLYKDGSTSQAKTNLNTLVFSGDLYADRFGRLTTASEQGAKQIAVSDKGILQIEEKK